MKTDDLIAAFAVTDTDEIFAISQTSKIIRFTAEEVPPKEGVVQGVNCMALRNDVVTAVAVSTSSVNSEP
jgi:DNA gyrase/topoisomerase IV subunit A